MAAFPDPEDVLQETQGYFKDTGPPALLDEYYCRADHSSNTGHRMAMSAFGQAARYLKNVSQYHAMSLTCITAQERRADHHWWKV